MLEELSKRARSNRIAMDKIVEAVDMALSQTTAALTDYGEVLAELDGLVARDDKDLASAAVRSEADKHLADLVVQRDRASRMKTAVRGL